MDIWKERIQSDSSKVDCWMLSLSQQSFLYLTFYSMVGFPALAVAHELARAFYVPTVGF